MNICPVNAIHESLDRNKKTVPWIDNEKCIDCGACRKVCPVETPVRFRYPKECYAMWSKDEKGREYSSSGGLATGVGKWVINAGGVVYGCRFEDGLNLNMVEGTTAEDIESFRGSKYVQSFTGTSYKSVKQNLEHGKLVLYIGTPCQIAGLYNFLGKDYEKLYTMDLICHGAPPIEYLKEYCNKITRKSKSEVTFRGENDRFFCLYDKDKCLYKKYTAKDYYYTAFSNYVGFRDNCYQCDYARGERISDITIGDFWGLDHNTLKQKYFGRVSVVLVNTERGKKLINEVKDDFFYEKRTVEEAIQGNGSLSHPVDFSEDAKQFQKDYLKWGFYKAVKKSKIGKLVRKNRLEKYRLSNIVKKI